jgi:hypothetical protein
MINVWILLVAHIALYLIAAFVHADLLWITKLISLSAGERFFLICAYMVMLWFGFGIAREYSDD